MAGDVIVATDFSPSARVAIGHAARIAGDRGVRVHAATVVDSDHIATLASSVPLTRDEVEKKVVERTRTLLAQELQDAGQAHITDLHVAIGRPGDELEDLCERLEARLLVLGYHGRTERGSGPGTVAGRCVRHAPCDVLLTRRSHTRAFRRVVAGVDFSESGREVVRIASGMADRSGGEVVLLHAHANPFDALGYTGFGLDDPRKYDDLTEEIREDLEKVAAEVRADSGRTVRAEVLLDAHYGRAIAGWCTDHAADLVVVGTRRKPGLRYWLLGSTAEYVLKETECAVLAVRDPH